MVYYIKLLVVFAPAALIVCILHSRFLRYHHAAYASGKVLCSVVPILLCLTVLFFYISFSWPLLLTMILAIFVNPVPCLEPRFTVLLLIFSVGALLVLLPLGGYYIKYLCQFDGQGVTVQTLWSGKSYYEWNQLSRVVYDRKFQRFEFYFDGRSHFRVSENQQGSQKLIGAVKKLGHPIEQYWE